MQDNKAKLLADSMLLEAQELLGSLSADQLATPWIVAHSGGVDSTALLAWLCAEAQEREHAKPEAIYVNHHLRSPEALAQEEAIVKALWATLGVAGQVLHLDPAELACQVELIGLEAAARKLRYEAIADYTAHIASRQGTGGGKSKCQGKSLLFLAHMLDDNTETIISRIFKGSGIFGLSGMSLLAAFPLQEGQDHLQLCRPFLKTSKAELVAYVDALGLETSFDESNHDTAIQRNWQRAHLKPLLEEHYGALDNRLALFAEKQELLEDFVRSKAVLPSMGHLDFAAWIATADFFALSPLERLLCLYHMWERAGGGRDTSSSLSFAAVRPYLSCTSLPKGCLLANDHLQLHNRAGRLYLLVEAQKNEYFIIDAFAGVSCRKRTTDTSKHLWVPSPEVLMRSIADDDRIALGPHDKTEHSSVRRLVRSWGVAPDLERYIIVVVWNNEIIGVFGELLGLPNRVNWDVVSRIGSCDYELYVAEKEL